MAGDPKKFCPSNFRLVKPKTSIPPAPPAFEPPRAVLVLILAVVTCLMLVACRALRDRGHPALQGAIAHTNNTSETGGLIETLRLVFFRRSMILPRGARQNSV